MGRARILVALGLLQVVPALAQGTFSAKNLIGTEKRYILNKDGAPLKVAVGRVELLFNGTLIKSGALSLDGVFVFGTLSVNGTAQGDTIAVTVRAWDTSTGATYDSATVRGSEVVQVGPLSGGTTPPIGMDRFTSFQLSGATTPSPGTFSAKNLIGTEKRYVLTASGTPLKAALGAVEFLAGGKVFLSGGLVEDGIFALGAATIPGSTVGGTASVTIRAWDTSTGSTYDTATSHASETIDVGPLGGDLNPPVALTNFQPLKLSGPVTPPAGTFSAKNLIGVEKRYILDPAGKPLSVASGAVELLVDNAVIASGSLVEDGIFVLGSVTVPGALEGATVSVTVRAWDKSTGSTYALATTRGSEVVAVGPLGGSITPPVAMNNFASFQLIATPPVVGGTFSAKNLVGVEKRYILNAAGAPLPKATSAMDIVYNGVVIASGSFVQDGIFVLGTVAVPGTVLGQTVTMTVRAWDTTTGATFDAATKKGSEDVIVGPLGGDITPPVSMNNFTSFSISNGLVPPVITGQPPASVVKNQGDSVSLAVTASGNQISFQWQKDGVNLANGTTVNGAATSVLALSKLSPASRGLYRVVVSNPAGSVTSSVVNVGVLVSQSISFGSLPALKYGDTGTITATASSGLPVTLKVASGPATLKNGNQLTATGVGTVLLVASQPGSAEYQPADANGSLVIAKAVQTLTWSAIPSLTYGDAPFTVTVTSSAGLPVTLGTTTTGESLTVSGNLVTIASAGTGHLVARQTGSALYDSVVDTKTITVAKAPQTLTFAALADTAWKTAPIPLVATSTSKLPITFKLISGAAQVQGSSLSLLNTGVGVVTISATQAGDGNYLAATSVNRSFTVTKATQTIAFNPVGDLTEGDPAVKLVATASSGLPVVFSVTSGGATIAADQLTPVTAGALTVAAKQDGNAVFQSAQASQTVNIKAKVTIPPTALIKITPGGVTITFRGEKGRAHAVEVTTALKGTPVWQEVASGTGNGQDADASVAIPAATDRIRFFRVRPK